MKLVWNLGLDNCINMQNLFSKLQSVYSREIGTRPKKKAMLYFLIFVANFILFGFFGVYRGYISYDKKRALLNEYYEILTNLEKNIEQINVLEPYLADNEAIDFINKAVPLGPRSQDYLEEFVKVTSKNGYTVVRFVVVDYKNGDTVSIEVNLLGDHSKSAKLIEDLEALTRLTTISWVKLTEERFSGEEEVLLTIGINYVDKE